MAIVSVLLGISVGALQMILTGKMTDGVLGSDEKTSKAFAIVGVKFALYALVISLILLIRRFNLLIIAVSYGIGMVAACAGYLIYRTQKIKRSEKSEEKTQ